METALSSDTNTDCLLATSKAQAGFNSSPPLSASYFNDHEREVRNPSTVLNHSLPTLYTEQFPSYMIDSFSHRVYSVHLSWKELSQREASCSCEQNIDFINSYISFSNIIQ